MKRLKPNAIKSIQPIIEASPVGVGTVVKSIQESLSVVTWLKAFGLAVRRTMKKNEADYIFPGLFLKEGFDYVDMMFNDNLDAYAFFYARDPEEPLYDYATQFFTRDIDFILWCNYDKIDGAPVVSTPGEWIKSQVVPNLKLSGTEYKALDVTIEETYDEPQDVFDGFTFEEVESQFLSSPFYGLRVRMSVTYQKDC